MVSSPWPIYRNRWGYPSELNIHLWLGFYKWALTNFCVSWEITGKECKDWPEKKSKPGGYHVSKIDYCYSPLAKWGDPPSTNCALTVANLFSMWLGCMASIFAVWQFGNSIDSHRPTCFCGLVLQFHVMFWFIRFDAAMCHHHAKSGTCLLQPMNMDVVRSFLTNILTLVGEDVTKSIFNSQCFSIWGVAGLAMLTKSSQNKPWQRSMGVDFESNPEKERSMGTKI